MTGPVPPKVTFIAQIIPQNEKVLTRTRLHLGVGNDVNENHQEMSPALLQSLSWDLDLITSQTTGLPTSAVHTPIVSFPPSFTPLTLGKLIWDSRTHICSYQHGHKKWIFLCLHCLTVVTCWGRWSNLVHWELAGALKPVIRIELFFNAQISYLKANPASEKYSTRPKDWCLRVESKAQTTGNNEEGSRENNLSWRNRAISIGKN